MKLIRKLIDIWKKMDRTEKIVEIIYLIGLFTLGPIIFPKGTPHHILYAFLFQVGWTIINLIFTFIYSYNSYKKKMRQLQEEEKNYIPPTEKEQEITRIKTYFRHFHMEEMELKQINDWRKERIELIGEDNFYDVLMDINIKNGDIFYLRDESYRKMVDKELELYLRKHKINKLKSKLL